MKQVTFREIKDIKEIYHSEDRNHVLVEWLRMISIENPRTVKCYVPAYAWKKDGVVILCYEYHPNGSYDPYLVKTAHDEINMPNLFEFTSIGVRECFSLMLGVLLGYDEEKACFRPFLDHEEDGKPVYVKWWDIPQLKDNWKIWTEC